MKTLKLLGAAVLIAATLLPGGATAACTPESEFGTTLGALPFNLGSVAVRDAYTAYSISSSENMFRVLDISGDDPAILGELSIDIQPDQIAYDADHVYILHQDQAGMYVRPVMTIIEVLPGSAPCVRFAGAIDVSSQYMTLNRGIVAKAGFVWIAHGAYLWAIDATDPADPIVVGRGEDVYSSGAAGSHLLGIVGDLVYASGASFDGNDNEIPKINAYDLDPYSNPDGDDYIDPVMSTELPANVGLKIAALHGGKTSDLFVSLSAYVATGRDFSRLERYACEADGSVEFMAGIEADDDEDFRVRSMDDEGKYLYLQTYVPTLRAIDISDPTALTLVGTVSDFYWQAILMKTRVAGASQATDRICDPPTIVLGRNMLRAYNSPGPVGGASQTWHFEWYTRRWTDPSLDTVIIAPIPGSSPSCSVGVPNYIVSTDPRTAGTVEYDPVKGLFKHHVTYWLDDCTAECDFNWMARSSRTGYASNYAFGKLMIDYCFFEQDPPAEKNADAAPDTVRLEAPAPNPFNPMTSLHYQIPRGVGHVSLTIHDIKGRVVRRLVDAAAEPGQYDVVWQGRNDAGALVPSGTYFARLVADGGTAQVQKLVLLK